MRHPRLPVLIVAAALLVAACGSSSATPTPAPDGGGGGGGATATRSSGGNPTTAPGGGGGGGGSKPAGWDKFGKVSFEITGSISSKRELGFQPAGSIFGGANQTTLSFTDEGADEIALLSFTAGGTIFQYGNGKITVPAAECKTSNMKLETSNASGSFDCTAGVAMNENGAMFTDVKVKGSFTAKP